MHDCTSTKVHDQSALDSCNSCSSSYSICALAASVLQLVNMEYRKLYIVDWSAYTIAYPTTSHGIWRFIPHRGDDIPRSEAEWDI